MVANLIDLHGEEGLSHSADGWRRILEAGHGQRVRVLNLLKFREQVTVDEEQMSGREAYSKYLAATSKPFARVGGRLIARGDIFDAFAFVADGDWDSFVVTEYPTGGALATMWLDTEFVSAHRYRHAGVSKSIAAFSTSP